MEIERKFLIDHLPDDIGDYPSLEYEQGYLSTAPVVRVRREGDDYVLTYKDVPSHGLYVLRDKTKGWEERIFTYEDDQQVWW